MRPILLLGARGQLGRALQPALVPLGELVALDRQQLELTDFAAIDGLLARLKPGLIVNAAAYTAVDQAEAEPQLALRVNALAVGQLAAWAAANDAWLLHYSTDYVFDGALERPYREDDPPRPINAYGRSKLAAEQLIAQSGCRHLIFRTSWLYSATGNNFVTRLLALARERHNLSMVSDQIGAPTPASWLAQVSGQVLARLADDALAGQASGIYHVAAAGQVSRYQWARYILTRAQGQGQRLQLLAPGVQPIATARYPTLARRPLNSLLDTARLQRRFGVAVPDWQRLLEPVLKDVFDHEI